MRSYLLASAKTRCVAQKHHALSRDMCLCRVACPHAGLPIKDWMSSWTYDRNYPVVHVEGITYSVDRSSIPAAGGRGQLQAVAQVQVRQAPILSGQGTGCGAPTPGGLKSPSGTPMVRHARTHIHTHWHTHKHTHTDTHTDTLTHTHARTHAHRGMSGCGTPMVSQAVKGLSLSPWWPQKP